MGHQFSKSKSRAPSQSFKDQDISTPSHLSASDKHRRSGSARVSKRASRPPHGDEPPPPSYDHATSVTASDTKSKYEPTYGQQKEGGGSSSNSSATNQNRNPFLGLRIPEDREERIRYLQTPLRQESKEDALEVLKKYDTVIVVDDSGSMAGRLWTEARDALSVLADAAAEYDQNGIDIYFLNDPKRGKGMRDASAVKRLFDSVYPGGRTPLGERLDELLKEYIDELDKKAHAPPEQRLKPVNYIVLTDGRPTDDPEDVITHHARRLDQGRHLLTQVGLQFVQIGSDPEAKRYLENLDSNLHGVRDIVDTTPFIGGVVTADMIIKILIGAINRRVDREGAGFLQQSFIRSVRR
ncbi:hypothetical protein C8Q74DRAFT_1369007 [Fomes fomentarius]|nr:hypothetical protein C8Q74DRAFT_1369007 [Fomes fomentarius]